MSLPEPWVQSTIYPIGVSPLGAMRTLQNRDDSWNL